MKEIKNQNQLDLNNKKTDHSDKEKSPQVEKEKGDEVIELKASEYEKLLKDLGEYKDKYIRLYADFENARKRLEREKMEFMKYAHEGLMIEFLGILDDLERSVEAANSQHEDYKAFLKGVELVMAHIYEMLKRNDVKPIETVGKKFDPHCHEILMQVEVKEGEDGMVVEQFQKGYCLGDKVIRTAKVKVAVRKQEHSSEEKDLKEK